MTGPGTVSENGRGGFLERLAGTTASLHLPSQRRSKQRGWEAFDLLPEQTALSRIRDPINYPELTHAAERLRQIAFYRECDLSRFGALRASQRADLPGDHLQEGGSNLWLVLNAFELVGKKPELLARLQRFYEPVTDYQYLVLGGTIQLYIREQGLASAVPATRLSDGTLRYLCLLAILLDPSPPPLICIEEPETGLHPDILPTIVELLVEASQRTQLIVTTHSETLISALGDHPEAVIVCERDEQGTRLERLEPGPLQEWLAKYSLGRMWRAGQIGGNRF